MSLFEDFAASVTGLGTTLLNAAEGNGDTSDSTLRANYVIARVNVAVAEALAKQAALETGDKAVKLVQAAALMIGNSEQSLLDAASREKEAIVQDVKDAYQKAVDVGVAAVKGVHDQLARDASSVVMAFETQAAIGLGLVLAYVWWQSRSKGPSAAEMRRAVLAGEA